MPPKIRVTKEEIVNAAVELVRQKGEQALNARTLALALDCSTQPIFSNFQTMEQLRLAVVEKAYLLSLDYEKQEIARGQYPDFKATGMAYIRFAREEKELFKLLYMRDRGGEQVSSQGEDTTRMEQMINQNTGLCGEDARLFHLEIWAYVHGIASMFATGYLDLEWALVSQMLTDAYQGLKKQHGRE